MTDVADSASLDPTLIKVLRCPLTRSPLKQEGDRLIAEVGKMSYPIREGIPVMLIEEATLPPGVESIAELKRQLNLD